MDDAIEVIVTVIFMGFVAFCGVKLYTTMDAVEIASNSITQYINDNPCGVE